ncbi:MAG: UDP-N-acetylmuramoyl-tripeptide--D-alanyl-D-alanine ligase [bacterium]|nr:UDP-N-acetylmuramoyl-tripeptide--D-alanyl-D-alanine ligase [bacterium]
MNPVRLIRYHIALLQLEQYDLGRYFGVLARRYSVNADMRQKAVWTTKLKAITLIAATLATAVTGFTFYYASAIAAAIIAIISLLVFPAYLALAVLVTLPLDAFAKGRVLRKARRKLAQLPNLKVVAITGSYGKTTMKAVLAAVLTERFATLATPESVNTPIGIARFVLEKVSAETEVLVVEMGAYRMGDIRELCALTPPDVAVLTGINEAHIERFGGIANTVRAKFEIVRYAKKEAAAVLNIEDKRVRAEYGKNLTGHTAIFYGDVVGDAARYGITDVRFELDGLRQSFSLINEHGEAYRLTTPLLGGYAPATLMGAVCVAETLGMTRTEITHGVAMARPVAHRLEPFNAANGILVIDDSYNGNPDGAREAVRVLARFKNKRKIYVTPGLVEMGSRSAEIHRSIGTDLAAVADIVILIKNSATGAIAEGLKAGEFKNQDILWFDTAIDAHAALPAILKSGDVVLFQNDWPDNYL